MLPDKLEGPNRLCFVQDGVVIAKVALSPFSNYENWGFGAVAFLDATNMEKDPSGFRIAPTEVAIQTQAAYAVWKELMQAAVVVLEAGVFPEKENRLATVLGSNNARLGANAFYALTVCLTGGEHWLPHALGVAYFSGEAKLRSRLPSRGTPVWNEW
jgi:hypothetical protein